MAAGIVKRKMQEQEQHIQYIHEEAVHNLDAPRIIVPYLIEKFYPASVVDIGCGIGTFLHAFRENGVENILGIDGKWVDKAKLFIPPENFIEANLEERISINRQFDLVVCLEVAEHLSQEASDILVDGLTSLGNKIIFSAATKNQGGQNHINEQPPAYWKEKFSKREYIFYDVLRSQFWNNSKVDWWYRQNMFLVMHKSVDIQQYNVDFDYTTVNEYIHPELLALQADKVKLLQKKLNTLVSGRASGKQYISLLGKMIRRKFLK